jgi:hypothetical protein
LEAEIAEYGPEPTAHEFADPVEWESFQRDKRMCELIGMSIPDEKTRRAPGFNLQEWRRKNGWNPSRDWFEGYYRTGAKPPRRRK